MTDASSSGAPARGRRRRPKDDLVSVRITEIATVGEAAYVWAGATPEDARFLFEMVLDKAMQGDHARGLSRVPHYVAKARLGKIDLRPEVAVVRERQATALVDGGARAAGPLVCRAAMDLAIAKAGQFGVGVVGARAQGEILTPYIRRAVDAGLIGMAFVQGPPTVAPLGGYEPLLGNAPIAVGVPAGQRDPVILDMSLTQSSASRIVLAAELGHPAPPGTVLDERGEPTTDARSFAGADRFEFYETGRSNGTLTPLGNNHKGYALVLVMGLLATLLTDGGTSWELLDRPRGRHGTVLIAIDPTAFSLRDVGERVDEFVGRVVGSARRPGADEIVYPGQRSQALRRRARDEGLVSVPADDLRALQALAGELGTPVPVAVVGP